MAAKARDVWIFGYGSLMWRPDFPHTESQPALLYGYHRSLCIYSIRYRGTDECPGLVLGLDRGGSCRGRAFRVRARDRERVIAYLHEREMMHRVYDPSWLRVRLPDRIVRAYAFVVCRDHPQYAGQLSPKRAVALILQGRGLQGACLDYVRNTVRHLDELGIADGPLHDLLRRAEAARKSR
jgi:cation transport protein ChaC